MNNQFLQPPNTHPSCHDTNPASMRHILMQSYEYNNKVSIMIFMVHMTVAS